MPRGCDGRPAGSCNTVWADRGFGVLFEGLDFGDPGGTRGLYLQAFVAE